MQNKTYIAAAVILALVAAGAVLFLARNRMAQENSGQQLQNQDQAGGAGETEENVIVIYTDDGFSPNPLTVKVGTVVVFKNESSKTVWPASAMHPTHDGYPTTGGCKGSTFDACRALNPGESWPFKFEIKGVWKYHNHLDATQFGQIGVE